jgi:hypothetical protein
LLDFLLSLSKESVCPEGFEEENMRVVADGPVVVCSLVPDTPKINRDVEHERDTKHEASVKTVQQTEAADQSDALALGSPAGSTLMKKRSLSPLRPKKKAPDPQRTHLPEPATQTPETEHLPTSVDRPPHLQPAPASRPASAPPNQVVDTPVPRKRHTNQPSTHILIKNLHGCIRDRAKSLDPEPLEFYWDFTANRRYWVKDPLAFECIGLKNIPWMVTNGTLVETSLGLRWAGGEYTYLLVTLDEEEFPLPEGMHDDSPIVKISNEFVRGVQVERWKKSVKDVVTLERPPTPIVQREDPLAEEFPVLEEVRGLPPTPSSARNLRPESRSALSRPRNSSTPASPFSPLFASRPRSPMSEKGVRFHCKKHCRTIEHEVDEAGVEVEEEGKVIETKIDETENLSDNEGRTSKRWLGKN